MKLPTTFSITMDHVIAARIAIGERMQPVGGTVVPIPDGAAEIAGTGSRLALRV